MFGKLPMIRDRGGVGTLLTFVIMNYDAYLLPGVYLLSSSPPLLRRLTAVMSLVANRVVVATGQSRDSKAAHGEVNVEASRHEAVEGRCQSIIACP